MIDNTDQYILSNTKFDDEAISRNQTMPFQTGSKQQESMFQVSMRPFQENDNDQPLSRNDKNIGQPIQYEQNIFQTEANQNLITQNSPGANPINYKMSNLPSNEDLINLTRNKQSSIGSQKNYKNQQQMETTSKFKKESPAPTGMLFAAAPRVGVTQNYANLNMIERQKMKEKNLQLDHCLSIKELQKIYKFDVDRGLTNYQAVENRSFNEKNEQYPYVKIQSFIDQKWEVVKSLLLEFKFSILLAAIIFFCSYGNYLDDPSQVLLGLLLLWVIIFDKKKSYDQNNKEKFQKIFQDFIPEVCTVIREGREQDIYTSRVIMGDIIVLKKNSIVPVDCRVHSINQEINKEYQTFTQIMKADQSALFKDKLPRNLNKNCNYPTQYLKSSNIILQGAKIIEGSGKAVAILSANESYCSKTISQAIPYTQNEKKLKNPIKSEVYQFATIFSYLSIGIALIFLLISYLKYDASMMTAFIFAGCVFVAFIPEGLLTQLYFAKSMKHCVLSKKEDSTENSFHINVYEQSVETLGYVTCICSNISSFVDYSKSQVNGLWFNGQINNSNTIFGGQIQNIQNQTYQNLILGSILANESYFTTPPSLGVKTEIDEEYLPYEAEGNYIDTALIRFCQPICDVSLTRSQYPLALNDNGSYVIIPYDQKSKLTITVVEQECKESDFSLYIKGPPEKISQFCSKVEINGFEQNFNDELNKGFSSALRQFAKQGETVVAVAKLALPKSEFNKGIQNKFFDQDYKLNIKLENLTMLGLISLTNPISSSIQKSIKQAKSSGTKLFLISECDTRTTLALAVDSGLISDHDSKTNKLAIDDITENSFSNDWEKDAKRASHVIVNASRLQQYSLEKNSSFEQQILDWLMKDLCIFSNASVQQKQLIIPYLRKLGYTIAAMSNDIEDLPFISSADISVAGTDSTPLLQRLSDVYLICNKYQSDISSILEAIEEGRSHQENAKKIFAFSGSTKMAQIIPLIAYIVLRIPLSLSAMFMILVSCLTNFIPAISLAEEEPDIDTLYFQKEQIKIDSKVKQIQKKNKVATFSLFFYSYFLIGAIASAAGFCAFFTTMNHLGFPIKSIYGLFNLKGYQPNYDFAQNLGYDEDVISDYQQKIEPHYDIPANTVIETHMPYWNSLFMMPDGDCEEDLHSYKPTQKTIDWNDYDTSKIDLRKFYVYCDHSDKKWKTSIAWSYCDPNNYVNYSTLTENSACYTSEALNYGQTAYFLALVFFQFSNLFALKSLRYSFSQTPFNGLMVFSFFIQIVICVMIVQIPGIQLIFRSRPLHFWQWGIPAIPFSIFVLLHEELRKYLVRTSDWFKRVATF